MSRTYHCDVTGQRTLESEVSILRVRGPLAELTRRKELHVGPDSIRAVARLFNFTVADPAADGSDPFAVDVSRSHDDPLDRDATAADLAPAIRVGAIANGTPARSRPPKAGRKRAGP